MNPVNLILFSQPVRKAIKKTAKIAIPLTIATGVAVLYQEGKKSVRKRL